MAMQAVPPIERCVTMAELCGEAFYIKYDVPAVQKVYGSYGFTLNAVHKINGVEIAVFVAGQQVVVAFPGYGLVSETEVEFTDYMTRKVTDFNFYDAILAVVFPILHSVPPGYLFVTGHGIGGYYAEIVASRFDLPGIAFCSPGLKAADAVYLGNKGSAPAGRFQIVSCKQGGGSMNGAPNLNPLVNVGLFCFESQRSYIEYYTINNVFKYFNQLKWITTTISDLSIAGVRNELLERRTNGIGRYDVGIYLNEVCVNVNDLPLPGFRMDLYVIDLTDHNVYMTQNGGLAPAIEAVQMQVNGEFKDHWGARGDLFDRTRQYYDAVARLHSTLTFANSDEETIIKWIVTNDILTDYYGRRIDWRTSGIIFLVNSVPDARGYHSSDLSSNEIPYGTASVKDADWTRTFSHEVLELLANPKIARYMHNRTPVYVTRDERWDTQNWKIEVCDPCKAIGYIIKTPGRVEILVSDFVLPRYFDVTQGPRVALNYYGRSFDDARRTLTRGNLLRVYGVDCPFPLLEEGYLPVYNPATNKKMEFILYHGVAEFEEEKVLHGRSTSK